MKQWVWVAVTGMGLMGAPVFAAQAAAGSDQTNDPASTNQTTYQSNALANPNGPNPDAYPENAPGPGYPYGSAYPAEPPRPGTINYIEGAATLDGNPIDNRSVGSQAMSAGDTLTTGNGKAEILLTPGIFLRVGSNSEVKMISPDLESTRIQLDHGRAGVEVDQIFPQNMVQIIDNGVTAQLMKPGYYEFQAAPPEAMVFKGEARIQAGVGSHFGEGKWTALKEHHQMALEPGTHEKPFGLNAHPNDDALYNWSSLRSHYLAEANQQIAEQYYGPAFYPGWYWDPYMWNYTYLGWDPFFSPFGWGFYPWAGFYGGWGFYGGGWYGGHGWHHPAPMGHAFADRSFGAERFGGAGFHGGGGFGAGGAGRR